MMFAFATMALAQPILAQGTAFTYQGQLQSGGAPANGAFNFNFALYGVPSGGTPIAGPLIASNIPVSNGLFLVTVDFGQNVWNGQTNWLQVGAQAVGSSGGFATLSPRQALNPAPYAIFASVAGTLVGTLPASQISGPLGVAQLPAVVITNNDAAATLASLTIASNLHLPVNPTVFSGTNLLIRHDALSNFFAGLNAGNLAIQGTANVGLGDQALQFCFFDNQEVAVGYQALQYDDGTNGGGFLTVSGNGENTAIGYQSMALNTNGFANTSVGYQSMYNNTSGEASTAIGDGALFANTSGLCNTAVGYQVLFNNTTGIENSAIGLQTMFANTTGSENTADGWGAMCYAVTGNQNVADGYDALEFCTNDSGAVAVGYSALENDNAANQGTDSGTGENTAVGYQALLADFYGTGNSAVGFNSLGELPNGSNNTAVGDGTLARMTTGDNNVAVGYRAGFNILAGTNNIDVGHTGVTGDNNIIRIGTPGTQTACYLAGTVYANGTFVSSSDRAAKTNIQPVNATEVLGKVAALPISRWNYKRDDASAHIGPMAQDFYSAFAVGPDNKHITTIDEGGVALAAIQGLNQKLEAKEAEITELRRAVADLQAAVKALAQGNAKP